MKLSETDQKIQFNKHVEVKARDVSLEQRKQFQKEYDNIMGREDDYVIGSGEVGS